MWGMSGTRKLVTIVAWTIVLFVGSFALSFLAMDVAFAQPAASEAPPVADEPSAGEHKAEHPHHDPSKHFRFFGSPIDHYGKDEMGGKLGDGIMTDPETGDVIPEEEPMSPPFIFMVLNFVVLVTLLAWKGKPAVQKLAADRHDQIKTALDEAAKLRKMAADKLAEYELRLKDADAEIKKMVDDMKAVAETDKQRILEAADRQATQLKVEAEQRIAAEIEYARAALTREVTVAATAATERILREKMGPSDQQKVIGTFITGVSEVAGSASKGAR